VSSPSTAREPATVDDVDPGAVVAVLPASAVVAPGDVCSTTGAELSPLQPDITIPIPATTTSIRRTPPR
jgi:hypothetical protein